MDAERRQEIRESLLEIRRLNREMLRLNKKYDARVTQITELNRLGKQNYGGNLGTVLDNDLILGGISAFSRTVATLIAGYSAAIQAELVYLQLTKEYL
jgi:hypothetical protein